MSFTTELKLFFSNVWSTLEPFFTQFLTTMGGAVLTEALLVVPQITASMSGASGTAKRDAAIAQLEANLIQKGIQASTTLVINSIQAAYTKLNPEKATATKV